MTPVQWLFHYLEVEDFKKEKIESDTETIKAVVELYNSNIRFLTETIIDAAKIAGGMANPHSAKALLDAEQLAEARADIGDDDFSDWWEDFSARIPGELKVEDSGEDIDLEGDGINLEKLYEIEMEARRKMYESKK